MTAANTRHSAAPPALPMRAGTLTVAEMVNLYMAHYAGLVAAGVGLAVPTRLWDEYSVYLMGGAFVLLVIVLIPGLGWLFRARKTDRSKTNTMVFIRPTIIRSAADARRITAQRYGTGLVRQLNLLASSVDEELHQQRLRQAAKSETRMLLPLVFLILPITVVFALYPSLTLIQTNY